MPLPTAGSYLFSLTILLGMLQSDIIIKLSTSVGLLIFANRDEIGLDPDLDEPASKEPLQGALSSHSQETWRITFLKECLRNTP